MADAGARPLNVAEVLAWDDGTDRRYELVRGEPVAMAPPSVGHGELVVNLAALLKTSLRRPCAAIAEAGVRIPGRDDRYYQADLAVRCAKSSIGEQQLTEPVLIIEVLSPSTAARDRGTKLPDYRTIPSLMGILLVSSWERRVELWRREGELWTVEDLFGEGVARVPALGIELPLAAIYDAIALEEDQGTASST